MLNFLRIFKDQSETVDIETMRARFERVTSELNDVLQELDMLPDIVIHAADRRIEIAAPDQFADEALALPAPQVPVDADTT